LLAVRALLTGARPSFSADWGDYSSFAHHLRRRADDDGVDLLVVDTGDRVEGNGLYDGSEPKGEYYYDILKQQNIDLICSGNHELYVQDAAENEFYKTVPAFKSKYIASNLDIINPETGKQEPLAPRLKKFTTKNQGIRIMAFGFLFDFTGNANNTVVQPVEDTVKEKWFQDAIRDRDVDLLLVFGHVAIRSKEYEIIYKAIRDVQWDTPISFLGGHAHVRDYRVFEDKAVALASGRYLETVGFMSVSGLKTGSKEKADSDTAASVTFSRRYIDNNLFSLYHHSGTNASTFPTEHGKNITDIIVATRKKLHLGNRRGCAPQDLWVNRAPYPSENSIFTWLEQSVIPEQLSESPRVSRSGKKALAITNTGAMRFDIFEGPFTKDTEYLVSPFTSGFRYLSDVPYKSAARVIELLNNEGPIMSDVAQLHGLESWMLIPPEQISGRAGLAFDKMRQEARLGWQSSFARAGPDAQVPLHNTAALDQQKPDLIPGYTTIDDLGEDGDDTIHNPIAFYDVPNCIQAPIGFSLSDTDKPENVDLVYNEFIQPWVVLALKYLGEKFEEGDSQVYLEGQSLTDVIRTWVERNWQVSTAKCP
jgi:Calcineurin-like phosphoesterase